MGIDADWVTAIATVAAATGAFFSWRSSVKANNLANDVHSFHKNLITKQEELKLVTRIIDKLTFHVLLNDPKALKEMNYENLEDKHYPSSDDAFSRLPHDVYVLVKTLQAHSSNMKDVINEWEKDLFSISGDNYYFQGIDLRKKIVDLQKIRDNIL